MGPSASQFSHSARMRRGALLCASAAAALIACPIPAAPPVRSPAAADRSVNSARRLPTLFLRQQRIGVDRLRNGSPIPLTVDSGVFDISVDVSAQSAHGRSGRPDPKETFDSSGSILAPLPPGLARRSDVEQLLVTSNAAPAADQARVQD